MQRIIRSLALSAAILLAGAGLAAPVATAETFNLTLVQTNDIDRMEADHDRGGFAKLAAVVKAERAKGDTLFIHSGDTLSPSLLSGIDKGAHIIDILNHLQPDAMTPGNHEFDFGADNFRTRIGEAKFPILSANIHEPGGVGPANTVPSKIIEVKGVKIGLYGLTTEDTPTVSSPGNFTFANSLETGKAMAKSLRAAGANIVIAVVHTPVNVDFDLVRSDAADIVLSGHDEHLLAFYDGKHVLTESGSQADWIVVTDLTIDRTEKDGKVTVSWHPEFRIIDSKAVTPDPDTAALVKTFTDKLDQELGVQIGTTETPLDSRRASVRSQETAIGNLIADAIRQSVGAEIGITNGGGIRADRQYDAGTKLTRKDVLAELPFGNMTVKLELTGDKVRAAIENGLSQVDTGAGRFPQVSGLTVTADLTKPVGQRVLDIKVGDAPLDPAKTYTVATNDFMAAGGDGYTSFVGAKNLIAAADAIIMASQVIDYVAARGTIAPKVEGRIVLK